GSGRPDRRRDGQLARLAGRLPAGLLRVRTDRLRRGGQRHPGGARARPRPGAHRTVRPVGRVTMERYTDGNALAGPLREIFAVELTAATGRCASCGRVAAVADVRVYLDAPGAVARCPGC